MDAGHVFPEHSPSWFLPDPDLSDLRVPLSTRNRLTLPLSHIKKGKLLFRPLYGIVLHHLERKRRSEVMDDPGPSHERCLKTEGSFLRRGILSPPGEV